MLSPSFERLPDHVVKKLKDGGFDTPEKVLVASDEELLLVPGIGKSKISTIRRDTKHPLALILEPFMAVAKEYHKSFKSDYPDKAVVLNMQMKMLTVGDFRNLYELLGDNNDS
jgi:hypothetical protein